MATDMVSRDDVSVEAQTRVEVALGSFRRTYRLWETRAPARYDYHGTLHLYGPTSPDKDESRFVLIPDGPERNPLAPVFEAEPYQVGRYRSGLYGTCRAEMFDRDQVGEMLLEALHRQMMGDG